MNNTFLGDIGCGGGGEVVTLFTPPTARNRKCVHPEVNLYYSYLHFTSKIQFQSSTENLCYLECYVSSLTIQMKSKQKM